MKWVVLGLVAVLLLPFYVYLLNKSAWAGKLMALKEVLKKLSKEEKHDEKEK